VTQRTPHGSREDKLEHSGTVHCVSKDPIERKFSIGAAGLATGDFSGGTKGNVGEKFRREENPGPACAEVSMWTHYLDETTKGCSTSGIFPSFRRTEMKTFIYVGVACIGVAVVCLVAIIGFAVLSSTRETQPTAAIEDTKPAEPIPAEKTAKPTEKPAATWKMTMAKYNALQTGMTYQEAVKIIGKEGEEQSRNDIAGITTVMYQWQNTSLADLGGANAMFQNGKLIQKAQFNLK
jgi:hypothetical protein